MSGIVILGAGLAGLSAAYHLRLKEHNSVIYEQHDYYGGRATSHRIDGFTFDEGPHVSFTRDPSVRDLFVRSVDGKFNEFSARLLNYYQGYWLKHPAQCHLYGLPKDLIIKCIVDLVNAHKSNSEVQNYADWCLKHFGKSFSENFLFRYTRKYWTVEPHLLNTEWISNRIHSPSLEDVLRGALSDEESKAHYVSEFRYPLFGGYHSYSKILADNATIRLNHKLCELDLKSKKLIFENGQTAYYETLISSLPLPELIKTIKDVPQNVLDAVEKLNCTSVYLVNIGLKRQDVSNAHWIYFYDEDIIFSRIHFPHLLSTNNVPKNCGSIQAEIYYSKYRPLAISNILDKVIEDLRRVGLILPEDEIVLANTQDIKYAYVIFDFDRKKNLAIIQSYLKENRIHCCGRYGEWKFFWSDQAILSGKRVIEELGWEEYS